MDVFDSSFNVFFLKHLMHLAPLFQYIIMLSWVYMEC
jgi:hypothetical protein